MGRYSVSESAHEAQSWPNVYASFYRCSAMVRDHEDISLLGEPKGLQCVEDTADVPVVVVEHLETLR